jgi:(p)ppGpp synthase/HD superfamily hydrolase
MAFDLTQKAFSNLDQMKMNDVPSARAFEYAKAAHASINQKRKYSGDPYIVHPMAVAKVLTDSGVTDEDLICAALLHDVLEDVWPVNAVYHPASIEELFGKTVLGYVEELTDEYTKELYPDLNRAERKKREAERISKISDGALKVKLADLIDNTGDIAKNDPGFAKVYLREKQRILDALHPRMLDSKDPILLELYHRAKTQVIFHSNI